MDAYSYNQRNKVKEQKNNITSKILIYIALSIIILLTWSFLGVAIVGIAAVYGVYKFARLAMGGFACPHCWFGFVVAFGLFSVSLFALNSQAAFLPVIFLWVLGFSGGKHRK